MSISFDKDKGFIADSVDKVREDVQQVWINAFKSPDLPALNTAAETPQGQIIDSTTASIMNKDNEVLFLANQFNLETADGIFLDALASIYFLQRQPATSTIVECECIGLQGVIIPAGAVIQTTDNLQLICLEGGEIAATGKISLLFALNKTGAINVAAHSANIIVTQIPGWDSVDNQNAGVIGRNTETRVEFLNRIKNSVAINSQGTVDALESAIANIRGVVAVTVLENDTDSTQTISDVEMTAHSVCISVFGGDNTEIANTIRIKKDAGCSTIGNTQVTTSGAKIERKYNILRPDIVTLGIRIKINNTGDLTGNIQDKIKQAVLDDFNGLGSNPPVSMASTIYATRFIPAIINTGVTSIASVELALLPASDYKEKLSFSAKEMPTLDINNIEVVISGGSI